MTDTRIILAGQSNALGFLNNGPAPYQPTSRVQIWADTNGDGVPDAWNYMLPGHNTGTLANPDVWGPEVGFANKWLAAHPFGNLWIVKSAKGSTGLAKDTGQGILDWSPESAGELFDTATAIVTAAKANLANGAFAFDAYDGLLWMQGEQDATDQAKANAYLANLKDFITHARASWFVSRIVIGRISDSVNLPYNEAVRVAQWQEFMDDADAPSFKTIGFDQQPDLIHYNAVGHIKLGAGFYYAFAGG
jgi:hypothetical protein